jgi:hypothetical protein
MANVYSRLVLILPIILILSIPKVTVGQPDYHTNAKAHQIEIPVWSKHGIEDIKIWRFRGKILKNYAMKPNKLKNK